MPDLTLTLTPEQQQLCLMGLALVASRHPLWRRSTIDPVAALLNGTAFYEEYIVWDHEVLTAAQSRHTDAYDAAYDAWIRRHTHG
jgi:hypothetical protein